MRKNDDRPSVLVFGPNSDSNLLLDLTLIGVRDAGWLAVRFSSEHLAIKELELERPSLRMCALVTVFTMTKPKYKNSAYEKVMDKAAQKNLPRAFIAGSNIVRGSTEGDGIDEILFMNASLPDLIPNTITSWLVKLAMNEAQVTLEI